MSFNRRQRCAAQHFGLWSVEPRWFCSAVQAVRDGTFSPGAWDDGDGETEEEREAREAKRERAALVLGAVESRHDAGFDVDRSGIALIEIEGQMTKGESSFGGASTVKIRRQVRAAMQDPDISGIFLLIDSPGGTVGGTAELADDVRAARSVKPVRAFGDDLMASAAFWVGAQADIVSASRTTEVGSIGTVAVLVDSSQAAEEAGIVVHVLSTGKFKGAGAMGAEVTDEHLAYFQGRVDAVNAHFLEAVMEGRGVAMPIVEKWADGRVFLASEALSMGLIDRVESLDEALEDFRDSVRAPRSRHGAIARARIDNAARRG